MHTKIVFFILSSLFQPWPTPHHLSFESYITKHCASFPHQKGRIRRTLASRPSPLTKCISSQRVHRWKYIPPQHKWNLFFAPAEKCIWEFWLKFIPDSAEEVKVPSLYNPPFFSLEATCAALQTHDDTRAFERVKVIYMEYAVWTFRDWSRLRRGLISETSCRCAFRGAEFIINRIYEARNVGEMLYI